MKYLLAMCTFVMFVSMVSAGDCVLFHDYSVLHYEGPTEDVASGPSTKARCGESASFAAGTSISATAGMAGVGFSATLSLGTTISWGLTGAGCVKNATHAGRGNGHITKQLIYEATWMQKCYKCSGSGCSSFKIVNIADTKTGNFATRDVSKQACTILD